MDSKIDKKIGRPSEYNNDVQDRADWYVTNFEQCGDVIPSRAGLCVFLGISRNTSYNWEENKNFLHTLEAIQVVQEKKALSGGLTNTFNSTITKLVLANHGYTDKQQVEQTIKVTDDESNEW